MNVIPVAKMMILLGAFLAFSAVALGSFGAHFLKNRLSQESLAVFEIGVRYQMYHALALILLGCLYQLFPEIWFAWAAGCIGLGTLIFSGSLYALACTGIKALGAITPIGGVAFLIGWIFIIVGALKSS